MLEGLMDLFGANEMGGNEPPEDCALGMGPCGDEQMVDMDGDGIADGIMVQRAEDNNGDGIADTLVVEHYLDLDGDGTMETMQREMFSDLNQDGVVDSYSNMVLQDQDNDGLPEYMSQAYDYDGDGILDDVQEAADLDGSGILTPLTPDALPDGGEIDSADAPGYVEFFDPDNASQEDVIGNPAEDMENWHPQETGSSCAVASQEFILEELSGLEFEESDLRDMAERNGWYDPNGGTPMDDVGKLLEHMGVEVERSQGNDVKDLEECLANGGKVIVAVDSGEIWYGEEDDAFGPGMGADHAIQVIGIDYSDPDEPMVIVNDSGTANGCGAMIPLDTFMDAWEDSGCFMVEAYA